MTKHTAQLNLMNGNEAVAGALALSNVQYLPYFPIEPATNIVRALEGNDSGIKKQYMESTSSAISAAAGASTQGIRSFTFTGAQALLSSIQEIRSAASLRIPLVFANVSRALPFPNLYASDESEISLLERTNTILFNASTPQDAMDFTILGYKISEHKEIQLPVCVNMDSFLVAESKQNLLIPSPAMINKFLGTKREPKTHTTRFLTTEEYLKTQLGIEESLNNINVINDALKKYETETKAKVSIVEDYNAQQAHVVVVTSGATSINAAAAVHELQGKREKIGHLKINLVNPFPSEAVKSLLRNAEKVIVLDRGMHQMLTGRIQSAFYGGRNPPDICTVTIPPGEKFTTRTAINGIKKTI